jgi:endo-1,4-beta-xylanase
VGPQREIEVRRRLCAVAVAATLTAALSAAHIIGVPFAEAATGSGAGEAPSAAVSPAPAPAPSDSRTSAASGGDAAGVPTDVSNTTGSPARGATNNAGASPGPQTRTTPPPTGPLRALAKRRGIAVGASVLTSNDLTDSQYASLLGSEYDMLTPENDMKWSAVHPDPGVYDFAAPDLDVSFAQSHGMAVRGHNLAWSTNNPTWLTTVPWSRDQLLTILHDHISTVVGHYRGKVAQWDVVNEGFSGFWWDHIGPQYIDLAFQWAHEADPSARLFFNDYGAEGLGGKSDALYNFVRVLKQRGIPIDGVGLESHFDLNPPPLGDIAANMRRLKAVGLQTAITEFDVRLPVPASAKDLDRQRAIYKGLLATCVAASNCKTFATWGFTDKVSWVPSAYPGYGAALPFDENYAPKPAYYGLRAALGG